MLSRLTRRAEFLRAAQQGRKAASANLVLQVLPNAAGETRVGFTATKKIGNAVARNRAKRRMRAAARLTLAHLSPSEGAPPADLVLIARNTTGSCPFPVLLAELDAALRRTGARP